MKNLINYLKRYSGVLLWLLFFLLTACIISLMIIGTIIVNG